jgi:hypothetical protein
MRLIIWVKILFRWLLVKGNRAKGLQTAAMVVDVFENVTKLTKTKKDDFAIEYTKRAIERLLIGLPKEEALETIDKINKTTKGRFKDVNIGFDKEKGFNAGLSIKF